MNLKLKPVSNCDSFTDEVPQRFSSEQTDCCLFCKEHLFCFIDFCRSYNIDSKNKIEKKMKDNYSR